MTFPCRRGIHDKGLPPMEAISFYVETYLERDIRDLLNVRHFSDFFRFLRLCAGRTAQTLNASTLAADVGIPPKTALEWMSILEAGYIVRRLPPLVREHRAGPFGCGRNLSPP